MHSFLLTNTFSSFYEILLPIGLILLLSKIFQIGCKKINFPIVVGMLLSGVCLAFLKLIPNQNIFNDNVMEGLEFLSKIGVVLIMFEAGIETDIKQIKSCGIASLVITSFGVFVPLGLGFLVSYLFFPNQSIWSNLFYGTILTATSVSVTIASLKELGKLNSKVGTSIVSAAIIDDVIGVILLSIVVSLSSSSSGALDILIVLGKTAGFFAFAFLVGFLVRILFNWIEKRHSHAQRLPIFSLAICFLLSYVAEVVFGIADITGAYIAGLILSKLQNHNYIDRRAEQASYMLFSPIFFAMIPIKNMFSESASSISPLFIGFGACFIIAGLVGKLLGCGLGAKICKFSFKDSYRIGLGMMVRAEVCLVCATKGIDSGLVDSNIMFFIIILILISSFITPLLLKFSYRKEIKDLAVVEGIDNIKNNEISSNKEEENNLNKE